MAPACECVDFPELFEGPEKTLTLCFKSRRMACKSLRLIPQEAWSKVLEHAKCEILSVVESQPAELQAGSRKDKIVASRGVTGYLLSESSLFVSDTSLVLKTCGTTTPLAALGPLLDLCVPAWQQREAKEYLKYATFMRLGYMKPEDQLEPHTSWTQEVEHMNKYFQGEDVLLGSTESSAQHVYVANYLPKDEVTDVFSTQVAMTDLDTKESMLRYADGEGYTAADNTPLKTAWMGMHGVENRFAPHASLDEKFFEPIGYSANGVFGKHFTTVHVTPQPGCSYLSVETSMPLTRDARQRFVNSATEMCKADTLAVTEFSLCPKLFMGGPAPDLPGFSLQRTSHTVGTGFACAHHHYKRTLSLPVRMVPESPETTSATPPESPAMLLRELSEAFEDVAARMENL